jgi:hypothetical protein
MQTTKRPRIVVPVYSTGKPYYKPAKAEIVGVYNWLNHIKRIYDSLERFSIVKEYGTTVLNLPLSMPVHNMCIEIQKDFQKFQQWVNSK